MPSDSSNSNIASLDELLEKFCNGSDRQRRSLLKTLETMSEDIAAKGKSCLSSFDPNEDDWAAGSILQLICRNQPDSLTNFYPVDSPGWFTTPSLIDIDYSNLQGELIAGNYENADRITSAFLRKLAGPEAEARGYVYFSEVESMSGVDLVTIDRLWNAYSQAKFGFTKQAKLLNALDGRYDKLWVRIGWKKDGIWTRYPSSFTWSIEAPEGHMPLVNQLRGVRLMDAILNHPALIQRR